MPPTWYPPSKRSKIDLQYDHGDRKKSASELRITELLEINLKELAIDDESKNMEGDIPSLALRNEFFMGVKIGWPFPEMLKPQRLMAMHIIKGLNTSKHVVLESPTGTGKSAAILCSTLAWQRYHTKTTDEKVKIIYCSRTHSQVAQMVASLQKTPYRPTMTVLGSRDRMCIHEAVDGKNVNNECRVRVKETESVRKSMYKSVNDHYDDQNPPTSVESDSYEQAVSNDNGKEIKPTCPHYRQLGAQRTASNMNKQFRPSSRKITVGDESTKEGSHDIEDLVKFGKNPYKRTVVLRKQPEETWGMQLTISDNSQFPRVLKVLPGGRISKNGTIAYNDLIFSVNHKSTASRTLDELADEMRNCKDKLVLRIGENNDEVSPHSACPYYISRALEKHAELIFCPYNYILDPGIRKALMIDLDNAVVVLDEAHNVESTLREGGSGKWSEMDLCAMIAALQYYAGVSKSYAGSSKIPKEGGQERDEVGQNEIAHELMIFLENIVLFMFDRKSEFEENGGARKALDEWRRFHTPDSQSFEMSYDGPSGYGVRGMPIGCRPFFEKLQLNSFQATRLRQYAESMLENVMARGNIEAVLQQRLFEQMVDVVTKLTFAMDEPQHYFVQTAVQANGSFDFAAGATSGAPVSRRQRQRNPKSLPYAPSRSAQHPNSLVDKCQFCKDTRCGHRLIYVDGAVRHGSYNTGAKPPWEAFLVLDLLTPARNMKDLTRRCRSVILASGSLAPLPSLCAELGLRASTTALPPTPVASMKSRLETLSKSEQEPPGRLQDRPPPLEADHVINLERQLLAVAIGQFPSGERLTVSYSQYKHDEFVNKMGDAIAAVIESIPRGGVLVFLPSYSLLRRCVKAWDPESSYKRFAAFDSSQTSVWSRFVSSKGKVIVEPTGSQADFEAARDQYAETIRTSGSCILFAVFRGKMSEGISFNDDNARGVICVGIPFPSSFDRCIKAKKSYNDEQHKLGKRTDMLPGDIWYQQQAFRAIGQALGRCIRHAGDYGTVILMDSRHCDESPPDENGVCMAHRQLPKWMRAHVRTLISRSVHESNKDKLVGGGWPGLQTTMTNFFDTAPVYAAEVLRKQQELFNASRERLSGATSANFSSKSGQWSLSSDCSAPPAGTRADAFLEDKSAIKLSPPASAGETIPCSHASVAKPFASSNGNLRPVEVKSNVMEKKPAAVGISPHPANAELIAAFQELANLYFRAGNANAGNTYSNVVMSLKGLAFEVTQENAKGLGKGKTKIAGIGKATADRIFEFVSTGKMAKLEEKREEAA